ncbi:helix-turn-helix domain-containing protein [Silvibacterium sp.]|uniref:helix-turn-helix domain-containing protein n=1 Tax=Silvibacterium sp. TaxID=1964179 RepID=UPI0039E3FBE5
MEKRRPAIKFTPEYKVLLYTMVSLRNQAGRTQNDMAKAMGLSQSEVSKCERGRRVINPVELRLYAQGIGMDFPRFVTIYEENLKSGSSGTWIKQKRTY